METYLCFIKSHDIKIYGEMDLYLHAFLNLALCTRELSISLPEFFTPEETPSPVTI